ncbi:MAG TPA: hypothetical protein VJS39_01740 [Gemmatimonadaceae bacterium]|nr:hypothetical protein [Gemmatimonadaceae bacterium]
MRYIALGALALTACARSSLQQPAAALPMAECYALTYSDRQGGATARLFPTAIELMPGVDSGRAEGQNLPDFLRTDGRNYKGWHKIGADSVAVMFTSTFEGMRFNLARPDSTLAGRAIWLTDVVGLPESSMRVVGTRENCPPDLQSAK